MIDGTGADFLPVSSADLALRQFGRESSRGSRSLKRSCLLYCESIDEWGASSAGRARRSQRRGRGFKSPALHQTPLSPRLPICTNLRDAYLDLNPRPGVAKGVCPLRGDITRGLAPSVGVGEGSFRPEPATEGVRLPCPPPASAKDPAGKPWGFSGGCPPKPWRRRTMIVPSLPTLCVSRP